MNGVHTSACSHIHVELTSFKSLNIPIKLLGAQVSRENCGRKVGMEKGIVMNDEGQERW